MIFLFLIRFLKFLYIHFVSNKENTKQMTLPVVVDKIDVSDINDFVVCTISITDVL